MPGVAGIELNISCPNVGRGGLQFAIDAGAAGEVTAAVRRATDLPLLVKLSPNVADVRPIARAIADAGADALTAINTLSGIAIAPSRTKPLLGNIYGGLSGPAVKPVALRIVYEVSQIVDIPVVAIGGVTELADVLDFLAVGAVAVQVGTAIFADPTLPVRLVDELEAVCRARGLATYADADRDRAAAQAGRAVVEGRRVPAVTAPVPVQTLTARQLNRATLARQLLLRRERLGVVEAVHRVVALQAQEPASPYLALWNRVKGLDPADVDAAFRPTRSSRRPAPDHAACRRRGRLPGLPHAR